MMDFVWLNMRWRYPAGLIKGKNLFACAIEPKEQDGSNIGSNVHCEEDDHDTSFGEANAEHNNDIMVDSVTSRSLGVTLRSHANSHAYRPQAFYQILQLFPFISGWDWVSIVDPLVTHEPQSLYLWFFCYSYWISQWTAWFTLNYGDMRLGLFILCLICLVGHCQLIITQLPASFPE